MGFRWHGIRLDYATDDYNSTRLNERTVEIPIARRWLRSRTGTGLEVGNVLSHYGYGRQRRIVDLYEPGDGVENIDVFDIDGCFDWIIAVSTIEHVRWDTEPQDPDGAEKAIGHLKGLLGLHGAMLVTIPTGHHPTLDAMLFNGLVDMDRVCTLVRDGDGGWIQTPEPEWRPYGKTQPWAEAVWIGEYST